MKQRQVLRLMQAVASVAVLSACGGGGSGVPASAPQPGPLEQVPPSASQTAEGLVAYLRALVVLTPEDREPLALSGFAPPSAEDTEPAPAP